MVKDSVNMLKEKNRVVVPFYLIPDILLCVARQPSILRPRQLENTYTQQ